jgi:hypothetical protein
MRFRKEFIKWIFDDDKKTNCRKTHRALIYVSWIIWFQRNNLSLSKIHKIELHSWCEKHCESHEEKHESVFDKKSWNRFNREIWYKSWTKISINLQRNWSDSKKEEKSNVIQIKRSFFCSSFIMSLHSRRCKEQFLINKRIWE